jgi:hypothetical protein
MQRILLAAVTAPTQELASALMQRARWQHKPRMYHIGKCGIMNFTEYGMTIFAHQLGRAYHLKGHYINISMAIKLKPQYWHKA